jgi:hypothetical protein
LQADLRTRSNARAAPLRNQAKINYLLAPSSQRNSGFLSTVHCPPCTVSLHLVNDHRHPASVVFRINKLKQSSPQRSSGSLSAVHCPPCTVSAHLVDGHRHPASLVVRHARELTKDGMMQNKQLHRGHPAFDPPEQTLTEESTLASTLKEIVHFVLEKTYISEVGPINESDVFERKMPSGGSARGVYSRVPVLICLCRKQRVGATCWRLQIYGIYTLGKTPGASQGGLDLGTHWRSPYRLEAHCQ